MMMWIRAFCEAATLADYVVLAVGCTAFALAFYSVWRETKDHRERMAKLERRFEEQRERVERKVQEGSDGRLS